MGFFFIEDFRTFCRSLVKTSHFLSGNEESGQNIYNTGVSVQLLDSTVSARQNSMNSLILSTL